MMESRVETEKVLDSLNDAITFAHQLNNAEELFILRQRAGDLWNVLLEKMTPGSSKNQALPKQYAKPILLEGDVACSGIYWRESTTTESQQTLRDSMGRARPKRYKKSLKGCDNMSVETLMGPPTDEHSAGKALCQKCFNYFKRKSKKGWH